MKKIIVIGAGVAGLSAAVRLQKLGYEVDLYEKEEKIGGKMNQIKKDGFSFDVGPTIVLLKINNQHLVFANGRTTPSCNGSFRTCTWI